jgi:hypothetical protein
MKVHIDICIDDDIKQLLEKEENKSGLINKLLQEHYGRNSNENLGYLIKKQAEMQYNLKEMRKNLKEIDVRISKINDKEKKVLDLFKGLSKEQRTFLELHKVEPSMIVLSSALKNEFKGYTFSQLYKFWRGGK